MQRNHLVRAVILLLSAGFTACGSIPSTHYYLLEWKQEMPAPSESSQTPPLLSIGVQSFFIDPPYDQDRIVFRAAPDTPESGFYAYHRWAAPLSRMLPRMVADGLKPTAGIASIEPVFPGRDYQAILEGRLVSLVEVDTEQGHEARVRLALTLRLPDGSPLWSISLEGKAVTRTSQVKSVVEKMNSVLTEVISEARGQLAAALKRWQDESRD